MRHFQLLIQGVEVRCIQSSFSSRLNMSDSLLFLPSSLAGDLPVLKCRILAELEGEIEPEAYLGSAWRGVLGWELQNLVCPFEGRPRCEQCIVRDHCPLILLFDQRSELPGLLDSPRGYILMPIRDNTGGSISLEITLVGDCSRFLPVILKALERAQRSGLGRARVRFRFSALQEILPAGRPGEVEALDRVPVYESPPLLRDWLGRPPEAVPEELQVDILTPLRLRKQGKNVGVIDWPFFFATLARRVEALAALFGEREPFGKEVWQRVTAQFGNGLGCIDGRFDWDDYQRYSNRQHKKIPMGGLVGTARFRTPAPWVWEWLRAGELLHVGKGAAMGLGAVRVSCPSFWEGRG